jgi:gliding motility-associated-like protein
MGADLTYRSLGGNQYEITLTIYRDCIGIPVAPADYIDVYNSCNGTYLPVLVTLIPGTGQEITPLCPSALSTCNGGTFTGIQQYVYRGVVTLPSNCNYWTLEYDLCCRNAAITTIPNPLSQNLNVFATINNSATRNDHSPVFSNLPVPFVCQGQQFCFSHGAYDPDGDSIVYQLIPPRTTLGATLNYLPGFSAQQPLTSSPAMSFDVTTGDFCFTPQMMEVTVMAVLVREYRNGVLIGTVERDIQVTVINCTNVLPQASGINGTNNFSINACAGQQTCFNINTSDADGSQTVTLDWDNSIPGATFSPGSGSRPTGTFCWTPSQSDIGSSTCFTATVTDNACPVYGIQTFTYCINVQGPLVNAGPDVALTCGGAATTTLSATASNGTNGNYSYQWSNGATTANTTVGPGTYVVSVTSGGCTSRDTVVVSPAPLPPVAAFTATSPCAGSPVSLTNTSTPASSIVQTQWNFGGGNTSSNQSPNYTFPGAGTYNVTLTVTNAAGCTATVTQPVTVQPPPVPVISAPPSICSGQSATLTVSGGGTYSWSPGGQSGSSVTVSPTQSQSYQVTVTSAAGCTATANVQVTVNPPPTATVTPSPTLCVGSANGQATVQPSGGTSPYTFSWSNGASGSTATGLAAGSYSVTVTDANGCTSVVPATVTSPTPVVPVPVSVPADCNGAPTGSVSATASGGSGPYSYSWNPGGAGSSLTGLAAGSYVVTATDANGCTATSSVTVSQPSPVVANATTVPALCNGEASGSAIASASGGTPGYTYSWSSGASVATAGSLAAGSYSVTITDSHGCTTTTTATVSEPSPLILTGSSTLATCGIANGSLSAIAGGGTPSYQYAWSPGGYSGSNVSGVPSGSYSVTITDANGCTSSTSISIANAGGPAVTASVLTNVRCAGGSGGSASVQINSGNGPFSISWPGGATGQVATNLTAGIFPVTVTDINGCVGTDTVTIVEPPPIVPVTAATPAPCAGAPGGSVSVNATGGVPGYTYSWSPSGGSSSSASNLTAGTYIVTLTDANGCTMTASAVVAQPAVLNSTASALPVGCAGASTGSATVQAGGGTPGYSYLWSNGSTGSSTGNVGAGSFTVTVTDNNGCTSSATATVTEPPPIVLVTSTVPAICGSANGSASVSATGGTAGYQYSWTPGGGTGTSISNLASGSYTVTVTDANGCTQTAIAAVSNSGAPTAVATLQTPVSCFGGSNGVAGVTASGGSAPYSYSWSNGGAGATASNLSAGTYNVTVTDNVGCVSIATVTIPQPPQIVPVPVSTPVSCNGGNNGTAAVSVTGGSSPYSYSWSGGAGNTSSVSGLAAGTYTVTVTDASGCTTTVSAVVTQPTPVVPVASSLPATCNGAANGSASVQVSGGTPGYTYSWSGGGGASSSASGLSAGSYAVTVTDNSGCTAVVNVTISQPSPIVLTTTTVPALCGSSNGSATVNASGGNPGYQYTWTPGGGNGTSVSNLASGSYTVTVTDANGCTQTAVAAVSNSGAPTASAAVQSVVSCYGGSNGSAIVTATGGAAPYAYNWSSGSTGTTANGLSAGTYNVTVTDTYGCVSVATVNITQPSPVVPVSASTPVSCNGGNNGTVSLTVTGGTSPYSYSWSGGAGNASAATGLAAGTYTVTVTDANGCSTTLAASVVQPSPVVPSASSVPASCFGGTNGSVSAGATGGTSPYSYSWSTGAASPTVTGLPAGSYTVTVTDANGCTVNSSTQVGQPSAVVLSVSSSPALCGSANGSASVSATGGTAGYSYSWSPAGGSSASASGLAAGTYSVAVTDANGCITTSSVIVQNTGSPVLAAAPLQSVSCNGGADGTAFVQISSGTAPFIISWPGGLSNDTISGLTAGIYPVTVTDANGCVSASSVQITEPSPVVASVTSNPVDCNGASTGSTGVTAVGGTPGYSYQWSPAGGTVQNPSGLPAGQYSVTVTDANGCTSLSAVTVSEPPPLAVTGSSVAVSCNGGTDGSASVSVSGGNGAYSYVWLPGGGTSANLNALPAGTYAVTVTDASGCTIQLQQTVTEPSPVVVSLADGSVSCFGMSDAVLQASVSGGSGSYQYLWSPGGMTGSSVGNLGVGNYSVVITDINGCTTTASASVSTPAPLTLQVAGPPVLCIGQNGTLSAVVTGGTQPLTYTWSNGGTGDSITVSPGTSTVYSVFVTDANGCASAPQQIPVNYYPPLQVQSAPLPQICSGDSATVSAVAGGGNGGPYAYSWNNGSIQTSSSVIHPVSDSAFVVTVSDGCSPSVQDTVYIRVNPTPVATFTPRTYIGCSPVVVHFGNIYQVPAGSSFQWNLDDNTLSSSASPVHTYAEPGFYNVSVIITSPEGCTDADTVQQAVQVFGNPVAGFNQSAGTISEVASDVNFYDASSGAVTWFWDFGDGTTIYGAQNPSHHYSDTGTFIVRQVVVNEGGCLDTITGIVRVEPESSIFIPNAFTPNGDGVNDGFIAIGRNIIRYEMWIIDRWGREISHSVNFDSPWDGTYYHNGNPCQNDVYEYVIDAIDIRNKKTRYIGHVTLVR